MGNEWIERAEKMYIDGIKAASYLHNFNHSDVMQLQMHSANAEKFLKTIYKDSTTHTERKYEKYNFAVSRRTH